MNVKEVNGVVPWELTGEENPTTKEDKEATKETKRKSRKRKTSSDS